MNKDFEAQQGGMSPAAHGSSEIKMRIKHYATAPDVETPGVNLDSYLNLAHAITGYGKDTLPAIDADTAQFMDNLLSILDEQSTFVIRKHFGLAGDPVNMYLVSVELQLSRGRAHQIEQKALLMLGRNRRSDALLEFVRASHDVRQKMLRLKSDRDFVRWAHPQPPASIDDLDFSMRAYNTLKHFDVYTLAELPLPAEQRTKVAARCGKKTLAEIETQLSYFDMRLFAE